MPQRRSQYLCVFTLLMSAAALSFLKAADGPALPAGVVATLKGHAETVYAVAFSPDGRHVLTGSFDKTLKLWETATGKEVKTFGGQTGHQNLVLATAFSPDGRFIASASSDNTAKLWDTPFSVPVREFAHSDGVNALALSPDGTRLAGAGKDGTVKLWNAADGKQLFMLNGHRGAVLGVAFGGNGQFLASSGADGTIRIWNPMNGQLLGMLGAHATAATAIVATGNTVYSAGMDGLVKSWKLPINPLRQLPPQPDSITAMILSSDGKTVVTACADKSVQLSNFDNGQLIRQWQGLAAPITAIGINANKRVVAAGTANGRLYLWNAADGKPIRDFAAHNGPLTGLAFHPQGTQIATSGRDGKLKLWNVASSKNAGTADEKAVKTIEAHPGGAASVAFHGNGTQLLSGGADKTVKFWNLANGQLVRTYGSLPESVKAVTFSRDFSQIAAAAGTFVKIWNTSDNKEICTLTQPTATAAISFSADKARIATAAADGTVRVWDAMTGAELQFFSQNGPVHSVAFHPSNNLVISACSDRSPVVNTIAIVRALRASASAVRGLAATPNGAQLLTAGDDGLVKLLNFNNGASERTFLGSQGPVRAVAVSRNGNLVATGGADKNIRVYTFGDGKLRSAFKTSGGIASLSFSPNGQTLAASCDDGTVPSWNTGQQAPAELGKPGQAFAHTAASTGVSFGADNVTIYTAGLDNTRAWKFASDLPVKNFGHGNYVDALAFNPAGTQLATGGHEGIVRIWDVAKGQPLRQINAHVAPPAPSPIYCIAWSPDGKQLVSSSYDRSLKLWDATSGALVREFKAFKEKDFEKGHRDGVYAVAFSPNGKTIASGGSDHTIKLWNAATGTVIQECINPKLKVGGPTATLAAAHPGAVYSLRFTADGSRLVSAGHAPRNHGYLAVWDASDAKLLHGEEWPLGNINSVAVSPDAKFLALACGPRGRTIQEAIAYVIRMPAIETRQTTRAER